MSRRNRDIAKELERIEQLEAGANRATEGCPRDQINASEAIAFLNRVVRGDKIGHSVPSISDRIRASKMLLDKTLPDLKSAEVVQRDEFNINLKYSATNDLLIEAQRQARIERTIEGQAVDVSASIENKNEEGSTK